jgi:hypothetical protein
MQSEAVESQNMELGWDRIVGIVTALRVGKQRKGASFGGSKAKQSRYRPEQTHGDPVA